ncbi:hypothetical protein [Halarcobacter ebronensis]|uniref:Uncharacterized protein n=1 Tax=Halarcobacter ebronensis TaxID=1462615 RepID=A0A4Q1ATF7_9BACT|nr:hypothetical protein [Halarcobacter ebronensis]QKF82533.1 hypothetical protein AEBR_2054 [Halarcobacter ebronensis]RXK07450.1 hypothetical protein CRV07_03035 [Halarcobacter ebronensis]
MIKSICKATSQDKNVVVRFSDKVIRYEVDSSEMAQDVSNLFNKKDVLELSEIWDTLFESINQYKKQIA